MSARLLLASTDRPRSRSGLSLILGTLLLAASCSERSGPSTSPLPAPAREGWAPEGPWPGFTLLTPLQSRRVYLVDMAGEAVHTWDTAGKPALSVYLTERGTLLKTNRIEDGSSVFKDAGGDGGWIQELDCDGDVLWDFRWAGEQGLAHHDIEELPNGNILFIAWDRTTREAALAAGRDPEHTDGEEFWPGAVYEVEPRRPEGGRIVWSWHALDHVIQHTDPALPNFADPASRPERIDINGDRDPDPPTDEEAEAALAHMRALGYTAGDGNGDGESGDDWLPKGADWLHLNGIDYNAELDQIALSVRFFDEIWIIGHGTTTEEAAGPAGDLLYRWGNPYAHGMGRWEDRRLMGQHNVQWIPPGHLGAGNLIVFNNGARPREHSSVDEWWAPRDGLGRYPREEGRPWGPQELEWTYEAPEPGALTSPFISGAQRLPNGNTLVCSGEQGWVFEVTPDGRIVWDWRSPFGPDPDEVEEGNTDLPTAMFRAERYGPDHPGIVALRAKGAAIPVDPGSGPATNQAALSRGEDR
jgi:hypothetical protein